MTKLLNVIKNFFICDRKILLSVLLIFFLLETNSLFMLKKISFAQNNEKINKNFSFLEQKEIIVSTILIKVYKKLLENKLCFLKKKIVTKLILMHLFQ